MIKNIEYEDIDKGLIKEKYILIDVRSPGEYKKATIPGAINVPIFTDEEREIIGTVYVRESVEKAKMLGMEAVSRKLPSIYETLQNIQREYKKLIFFCERGGMRSSSVVALFSTIGIHASKMRGGYKAYRGYINENLPKRAEGVRFIVLHGNTGVGKTNILKKLDERGYDVVDLEGCANHRGSLLGDIGLSETHSQKHFESLIYETLKNRKTNYVFVEAESKRIGHNIIPDSVFNLMKSGDHINLTSPIEFRVENIMEDYVEEDNNQDLIEGLNRLRKYISEENINRYINEIENSNYNKVIEELMIKYYDPMYENKKYDYIMDFIHDDYEKTCSILINWIEETYLINDNQRSNEVKEKSN